VLSVVMHEQGHLLDLDHAAAGTQNGNIMKDFFSPNQRILPTDGQAAGAVPGSHDGTGNATFAVTNLLDSGAGSLRQAILDANASVGVADKITFSVSSTITLTTGGLVDRTDSTIDNNTVRNENGGGIYNNGTVNLNNTDVSNNIALDLDGANRRDAHGGGFYNSGGTVDLVNGTQILSKNTWGEGGGFYSNAGLVDGEFIDGDLELGGQQTAIINVSAFTSVEAALAKYAAVPYSGTIIVNGGTYNFIGRSDRSGCRQHRYSIGQRHRQWRWRCGDCR
jgi:hypothetical protein